MKNAREAVEKMRRTEHVRTEENEENRKKAELRGRQAMEKIKQQREYENYCQEAAQTQISYNQRRIAAGQQNAYTYMFINAEE
jgi:hypothetical protein